MLPEPPRSVMVAVRIMYAGAALIGAWLFMARANRNGLKWARIVASVLFALGTWNLISHIIGAATVTNLAHTALMWLVGAGAAFFLWQKDSGAYFT